MQTILKELSTGEEGMTIETKVRRYFNNLNVNNKKPESEGRGMIGENLVRLYGGSKTIASNT
jgi:hypothetical protein